MENRRCRHCEKPFQPRSQNLKQAYCSKPECQRARKRLWQQEKLKSDSDYRENQRQAQKRWQKHHPDYWKQYRANHPQYVAHNRERQHDRNTWRRNLADVIAAANDASMFAKMDASAGNIPLSSGTYKLTSVDCKDGRVKDVFICKISRLVDLTGDCKERTLSP